MRWFLVLALCLGLAPSAGAVPDSRGAVVQLNGHTYLELNHWAAVHRMFALWNPKAGELRVTNRWARLFFKADTRRVDYDDVSVALSYPVLRSGDHLYLALKDDETVLRTLLSPPRMPAGRRVTTVALSAGHGGKDPGNLDANREEKKYTLLLAKELERALRQDGLRVVQVRDRDVFVPLEDRPRRARELGADLFICLHFNSSPSGEGASGLETYCLTPAGVSSTNDRSGYARSYLPGNRYDKENLELAYQIHRAVLGGVDMADRGVRHARFKELTLSEMPSAYVEGGYMSNPDDARRIFSETGRSKYAQALADGIMAYKRLVERGGAE